MYGGMWELDLSWPHPKLKIFGCKLDNMHLANETSKQLLFQCYTTGCRYPKSGLSLTVRASSLNLFCVFLKVVANRGNKNKSHVESSLILRRRLLQPDRVSEFQYPLHHRLFALFLPLLIGFEPERDLPWSLGPFPSFSPHFSSVNWSGHESSPPKVGKSSIFRPFRTLFLLLFLLWAPPPATDG